MDNRAEVRDFLVSRRAKVTPEQAGLPAGGNRRVAGLRRSEVATLDLHDLVGELSTRSEPFAARWGAHDVRHHGTGAKHVHQPVVGELDLTYELLGLVAEPGLTVTIYTAEPASPSEEALRLLASWAASSSPAPQDAPRPG